jgi:hypothetical protein
MHRALRQAAHPQQPLFQLVQVSFEVTFHETDPFTGETRARNSIHLPHPNRPVM